MREGVAQHAQQAASKNAISRPAASPVANRALSVSLARSGSTRGTTTTWKARAGYWRPQLDGDDSMVVNSRCGGARRWLMDTRVSGDVLVNRQELRPRISNKGARGLCVGKVAAQALIEAAQHKAFQREVIVVVLMRPSRNANWPNGECQSRMM
jgi:hypothetical protein